jgi:hypothetical protein
MCDSIASACLSSVDLLPAYLDPGSGSMLLQVLLAGALSGLFFLRSSVGRVRSWLRRD